jgi:hypothetical protein
MEEEREKNVDEEWKKRTAEQAAEAKAGGQPHARPPLPEAHFHVFVSGLAAQALIHLGAAENPLTGKIERDPDQAKYVIDLLQVIKDKTRGNLDPQEEKLLDGVLYDLRMRYVEVCR